METAEPVATWLELAMAPGWRKQRATVRVHPVGGLREDCYAISMDGRWLCASNGKLTVFKGRDAAVHFLKAVKIDSFEAGEPPSGLRCGEGGHFGLELDRDGSLTACSQAPGPFAADD